MAQHPWIRDHIRRLSFLLFKVQIGHAYFVFFIRHFSHFLESFAGRSFLILYGIWKTFDGKNTVNLEWGRFGNKWMYSFYRLKVRDERFEYINAVISSRNLYFRDVFSWHLFQVNLYDIFLGFRFVTQFTIQIYTIKSFVFFVKQLISQFYCHNFIIQIAYIMLFGRKKQ